MVDGTLNKKIITDNLMDRIYIPKKQSKQKSKEKILILKKNYNIFKYLITEHNLTSIVYFVHHL